jgi:hypothetical protein
MPIQPPLYTNKYTYIIIKPYNPLSIYKHSCTNEMGLYGYERLPYTRLLPMLSRYPKPPNIIFKYHIGDHIWCLSNIRNYDI